MNTALSVGLVEAINAFNSGSIEYTEKHGPFTDWIRNAVIQSAEDDSIFSELCDGCLQIKNIAGIYWKNIAKRTPAIFINNFFDKKIPQDKYSCFVDLLSQDKTWSKYIEGSITNSVKLKFVLDDLIYKYSK